MPVISTFQTDNNISGRVPGANLDTSGAGVIAGALAGVGAAGEKIATDLLMERKISEANEYNREMNNIKDVERNNFSTDMAQRMDPNTGRIIEGTHEDGSKKLGDTYSNVMSKWEADKTDELLLRSPTDLASEKFKASDGATVNKALVQYDIYQHKTRLTHRTAAHNETADTRSKSVQSSDSSTPGSVSTTENTIDKLEDTIMDYGSDNLIPEAQKQTDIKRNNNKIANAGVWNMESAGNLKEMGSAIGLRRLLTDETFAGEAKKTLEEINGEKYERVGISKIDGTLVGERKTVDKSGDTITFRKWSDEEGKFIDVEISKTNVQFGKEALDIVGEAPPNRILENLTPAQQRAWGNKLLSRMKQKQKESDRRLVTEHQGLVSSLKSTDINTKIRPDFDDSSDANTQVFNAQVAKIMTSGLNESVKESMVTELMAASVEGTSKESMIWDTAGDSLSKASNSEGLVDKMLSQQGFESLANDPLFTKKLKIATQNSLKGFAATRANNIHKAQYVLSNDAKARDLQAKMDLSPGAYQDYSSHMKSRYDQMEVPEYLREQFSKEYLGFQADQVNGFLAPNAGEVGLENATKWMMSHKANKGRDYLSYMEQMGNKIEGSIKAASLMPNTPDGAKGAREIMDSTLRKKDINTAFETGFGTDKKLQGLVANKLQDSADYISKRSNTSGDLSSINAFQEALTLQAKKLRLKGENDQDAVDKGFDTLFANNWTTAKSGDNSLVISNYVLEQTGMTPGQTNAGLKVYSEPNKIADQVDFEASIPSLGKTLDDLGLKGKARNDMAKKLFTDKNLGELQVMSDDKGNWYFQVSQNGKAGILAKKGGKRGEPLLIPMENIKNDPEVNDINSSAIFNFFGKGSAQNFLLEKSK